MNYTLRFLKLQGKTGLRYVGTEYYKCISLLGFLAFFWFLVVCVWVFVRMWFVFCLGFLHKGCCNLNKVFFPFNVMFHFIQLQCFTRI